MTDFISDVMAVVLSGGKSRRMGRDKLLLPLGGETLLARTVRSLGSVFDKVVVSVSVADRYADMQLGVERIADIYPDRGPLGGLHAALSHIASEDSFRGIFLVAGDLPFIDLRTAANLVRLAEDSDVCVTTDSQGRYEPLFAYYSKNALPAVEETLGAGINKVIDIFPRCKVKLLTADHLKVSDTEKLFFNINYPEDYEKIRYNI